MQISTLLSINVSTNQGCRFFRAIMYMESTCCIAAAVLPTATVGAMQRFKDAMKCAVIEMRPQKD